MILLYHKVHPTMPTGWWVEVDAFYNQMCSLQSKKVVYLDDYDPKDPDQAVITFDGVYDNVLEYAAPIMKKFGYPFEAFVTGDYVGKDNAFDSVEPLCQFLGEEGLVELKKFGGRLQWHTKTHRSMDQLNGLEDLREELAVPDHLRKLDDSGFQWFAYPHGNVTEEVIEETRKSFRGALSCIQGNETDIYQLNRVTVVSQTRLPTPKISLIIPSYNYGRFLSEAIESALRQTRAPDEILVIDDASDDETPDVAKLFASRYPDRIRLERNSERMGIVACFNKAVSLTTGDYVCFLGADNRFRSDYIEKTSHILDTDGDVGIAYTDFNLFGPRARLLHSQFSDKAGEVVEDSLYRVNFPDFDRDAKDPLGENNFIHGSSMYRRVAFNQVGGYKEESETAEDHNLFRAMVRQGWFAQRVPEPILEYRQHSRDQANERLGTEHQALYFKKLFLQHKESLSGLEHRFQVMEMEKDAHISRLENQSVPQHMRAIKNRLFFRLRTLKRERGTVGAALFVVKRVSALGVKAVKKVLKIPTNQPA